MNKLNKTFIEKAILVFFVIQPLLDMYRSIFGDVIEIFGLSLLEILNFLILGVLLIVIYVNDKHKKKWLFFIGYLVILLIYLILHYKNMVTFSSDLLEIKTFSFFQESYYICRLYFMPILALFILLKAHMKDSSFIRFINLTIVIICSCIIITNLFKLGLVAYATEAQKELLHGSILDWFSLEPHMHLDAYTSRGWFSSANQLSAILLILSPIVIGNTIEKLNFKNFSLFIMIIVSMLMLGTKTASYGIFAIIIVTMALWIFINVWKIHKVPQMKSLSCIMIIFCCALGILMKAPIVMKNQNTEIELRETPSIESFDFENSDNMSFADFIKSYCWNYYIQPQLLEIYPVEKDESFWMDKINRDIRLNSDFRLIKTEILNRVIERSDRFSDKLLGIGTLESLYNEKDYLFQYYSYGIVGILLFIFPFIAVLIYGGIKILTNLKNLFTFRNCSIGMSLCIALLLPYFTGHVFGIVFPMYYISMIAAYFVIAVCKEC